MSYLICLLFLFPGRYIPRVFGFRVHKSARQRNSLVSVSDAPSHQQQSPPQQQQSQEQPVELVQNGVEPADGEDDNASDGKPRTGRNMKRKAATDTTNIEGGGGNSGIGGTMADATMKRRRRNQSSS
jgi:hypothetical protein